MSDEQTMAPREILARTAEQWLGPGDVKQVLPLADAQLAALEAAGYVVVRAEMVRETTHVDWLIQWAREHGGRVVLREAKVAFVASGRTRKAANPANIYRHLYGLLENSEDFEKVGTGEWRYLDALPERGG